MSKKDISDDHSGVFSEIAKEINSHYKKDRVCRVFGEGGGLSSDVSFWVPTGCSPIDAIVGKGLPGRRIIEIFGKESCGKSTLLLSIMATCQKKSGFYCILYDSEESNFASRLEQVGVDKGKLLVVEAETLEDFFNRIEMAVTTIKSKDPEAKIVIGWDSLASTSPKAEIEGEYGKTLMGVVARIMSQSLRKFSSSLCKDDVTLIVVNQIRDKIGGWGASEDTPGGRALKFYSSVRLSMTKVEKIKDESGKIIGQKSTVTAVKNKVGNPFKFCKFYIDFSIGVDNVLSIIETLKVYKIENEYEGRKYKKGKFEELLRNDKEAVKYFTKMIRKGGI